MAECALIKSSQCFQDKSRIKKDLTKWTKNLLLLVGLERVAHELMGGRRWRKLNAPFNHLESGETIDWTPQEACYFCDSDKHDSSRSEVIQHSDDCSISLNPGNPSASCSCMPLIANGNDALSLVNPTTVITITTPTITIIPTSNNTNIISNTSLTEQPLDLSLHSRCKRIVGLNDSTLADDANPSLLKIPRSNQATTAKQGKKTRLESTTNWKRTYTEEELQQALNDIQSGKLGTRRAAVIYGIPRSTLRNKVYKLSSERANGKRSLTSSSSAATLPIGIQAPAAGSAVTGGAVPVQKSTKITEMKSSSVIGKNSNLAKKTIPVPRRSFNKLSSPDETDVKLEPIVSSPNTNLNDDSNITDASNNNINNNSIPSNLKQFLKRTITQRANSKSYNQLGLNSFSSPSPDNDKKETDLAATLGPAMSTIFGDPFSTLQMLSSMDCGNSIGPLISQILLNVHSLPWNNNNNNNNNNNKPTENTVNCDLNNSISGTLPFLPELIRKLAQERLDAQKISSEIREKSDGSCDSNMILKVPSYQPKSSQDDDAASFGERNDCNNKTNTSVRNNLGTFNNSTVSSHSHGDCNVNLGRDENSWGPYEKKFNLFQSVNSDESSSDALINENKNNYTRRKGEKRNPTNSTTSDQSAPSTPDPKRNRPKRGRYRNYKRDDLARAVRAVQMGEMSVHRAGTHFGVPHSTLEYKVKERHLLRPKKRQTNSSSPTSIINKGENRSLILPKNNLTESPAAATVVPNIGEQPNQANQASLWQTALPLFPLDIGSSQNSTNFFASNMMRKLKENARLNEETNNNTIPNTNNTSNNSITNNNTDDTMGPREREFGSLLLETLIKSSLERKMLDSMSPASDDSRTTSEVKGNSAHQNETGDSNIGTKYNASLAALKEVSSLDMRKE